MRSHCILAFVAAIGLSAPMTYAQADSLHTRVRLVADVASVRPGQSFTAGVVLSMDPGWHTYWINPGEAGIPTEIVWSLPDGISASETLWPLPHRHLEEGNVLTYGYTGEVMLLVPVQVGPLVRPGFDVRIEADVSWLECERICVPGHARVGLALPVVTGRSTPANNNLFEKYARLLPKRAGADPGISIETGTGAGQVTIRVTARNGSAFLQAAGGDPDFYPEASGALLVERPAVTVDGSEVRVVARYRVVGSERPGSLKGVFVYRDPEGGRQGIRLEIPLPGEEGHGAGGLLDRNFYSERGGADQRSLSLFLLFGLVGGLILNTMPCVLPVIALKVFGLVRMAGDKPQKVRRLGLMFSLGILASFLVLALLVILLKTAGQQVGWGFQFQEPLFVIVMSAIVFAFGLSLFGVYEIRLPGAAVAGVGRALDRKEGSGYLASFGEGVFATILATPCTAPFLGSALGFAFAQPAHIILLVFMSVACGMALPYLAVTVRPAWLRFLPKPGDWMVRVKEFMGFLMMATLLWLLYVLGKQLGMEAVIWTGAFLLAVGIACWLIGRFATLTASRGKTFATWATALVILAAGYWIFLESILNVRSVIAGQTAEAHDSPAVDGVRWEPFSVPSLEAHLQSGKTVFLDFTAEWCLTCKVNEKAVLADEEVVRRLKAPGVVAVKADWTARNPEITRLLTQFGRSGVPLYVVFPAGRPAEPIVLPEVITPSIVLEALSSAGVPPPAG
jgi:thiol:disulfide interchange protein DsbD